MHIRGSVTPMLATLVDRLPTRGYVYEPKWDGFRAVALVNAERGVQLSSRRGTRLNEAFPDIVMAVFDHLPPETVVDGEIVRWSAEGRLDFAALQRRNRAGRGVAELARDEPCHYIVFDLLETGGVDYRPRPLTERRAALQDLLTGVPGTSPLTLGMHTDDVDTARAWFDRLAAVGVEGVVAKPADSRYAAGARGWSKVKHYTTTEVIIGGVTGSLDRPRDLILGRYTSDTGELAVVGRTVALSDRHAGEIAAVLAAAGDDHPWPPELPPSWTGAAYGRRETVSYLRVRPEVVAEVRVDVATHGQRWRHGSRYLRLRPDLQAEDLPRDLDLEQ